MLFLVKSKIIQNIGKDKSMKKKSKIRDILFLQGVFIIYSISSIVAKLASSQLDSLRSVFSAGFILAAAGEVAILGIYALLWQQVIKRFELSIAYANKAMTLLWGLLWGFFIFDEQITVTKLIGIAIVFAGIVVMNGGREELS